MPEIIMALISRQYIANWHDSFVCYIRSLLGVVAELMELPKSTDEDKKGLESIMAILNGQDVKDVEQDLAPGKVKRSTLDKIENWIKIWLIFA